jgi:tripartite-type tricarboxylate transporter receptor subunit TctC
VHVPYKGLSPALNDIVAGHVQMMFGDFATALPLVKAGKLNALGVSTTQRVDAAPEIPPLVEVGLKDFDASSWQMMVAPAKIPSDICASSMPNSAQSRRSRRCRRNSRGVA